MFFYHYNSYVVCVEMVYSAFRERLLNKLVKVLYTIQVSCYKTEDRDAVIRMCHLIKNLKI